MSQFLYTFKLAFIKFKQKSFRNFWTIFSLSLGSILILTILIIVSGILSFSEKALKYPLYGKYLAKYLEKNSNSTIEKAYLNKSKKEIAKQIKDYPYQEILERKKYRIKINLLGVDLPTSGIQDMINSQNSINVKNEGFSPVFADNFFVKDSVISGYNFDYENQEIIPILLPKIFSNEMIEKMQNINNNFDNNPENYTKKMVAIKEEQNSYLKDKFLGKIFDLEIAKNSNLLNNSIKENKDNRQKPTLERITEIQNQFKENWINFNLKAKVVGFIDTTYLQEYNDKEIYFPKNSEKILTNKINEISSKIPEFMDNLADIELNPEYKTEEILKKRNIF